MDDLAMILLIVLVIIIGLFAFSVMGSDGGAGSAYAANIPQYSTGGACGR